MPIKREARADAPKPACYRVIANGVTGAGGASHHRGAILTAEQIGDDARIQKLLAKGAIEASDAA